MDISNEADSMQTISATQAKQNFAELLDRVQREPWLIQRHDRNVAMLISATDCESLIEILETIKKKNGANPASYHNPDSEA